MSIVITGGNGQVAWEVKQQAVNAGFITHSFTHQAVDIANSEAVHQIFQQVQPDIVINCAAYTAVDKAEQDIESAFAANHQGVAVLAAVSAQHRIPLLHLSTDYVFDGKAAHPYQEEDATAPLNIYGSSKLRGEQALRETHAEHIILRVSGVFGVHGNNFVKTLLRLALQQTSLRIVADQFTCPTPAADIAAVILTIIQKLAAGTLTTPWGTYHYCGAGITSWCDFAKTIIEIAAEKSLLTTLPAVTAITTADYPTAAQRPAYSVLNCRKLINQWGISQKPWREGLVMMLNALANANFSS